MKTMFEAADVAEVQERVTQLRPESERQWGSMTVAQAMAHCSAGLETALGDRVAPKGPLIGRIIGRVIKPMVLGDDKPFRRNTTTTPDLIVRDERDFGAEQKRLSGLIDRVATSGPAGCTTHPHSFFGTMTPEEWGILMYKHLDHHLRQFGA